MAAIEMEPLFSTPMPSFLETPLRTQWPDQNELTEITYEMIVTDHIATNLQELKANTAKKIDMGMCYGTWHSANRRYETTYREFRH